MSNTDAAVFLVALVVGVIAGRALIRLRQAQRQGVDPALQIRPPRQFVDADGRSDYRPELREEADRRRALAGGNR